MPQWQQPSEVTRRYIMYIVFSLYLAREQGTVRCVPLPPQFSGRLYRPTSIWESGNHPTICQPFPSASSLLCDSCCSRRLHFSNSLSRWGSCAGWGHCYGSSNWQFLKSKRIWCHLKNWPEIWTNEFPDIWSFGWWYQLASSEQSLEYTDVDGWEGSSAYHRPSWSTNASPQDWLVVWISQSSSAENLGPNELRLASPWTGITLPLELAFALRSSNLQFCRLILHHGSNPHDFRGEKSATWLAPRPNPVVAPVCVATSPRAQRNGAARRCDAPRTPGDWMRKWWVCLKMGYSIIQYTHWWDINKVCVYIHTYIYIYII